MGVLSRLTAVTQAWGHLGVQESGGQAQGSPPPANGTGVQGDDSASDPIDRVAGRLAGALGLVAAVATFFGIKEGELDRVLREQPVGVAFLFALILGGVVIGALLPAVQPRPFPLAVFIIAVELAIVGGLATLNAVARPNMGLPKVPLWLIILLVIVFVPPPVITWSQNVNSRAALLSTGALLFVVGLVFAVAVGVASRTAIDGARVLASFGTTDEDRYTLTVTAKATRLSTREVVGLEVRGVPIGAKPGDARQCQTVECDLLHQVRLTPDDAGQVSETLKLVVPPGRYGRVIASGAICDKNVHETVKEDESKEGTNAVQEPTSTTGKPTTTEAPQEPTSTTDKPTTTEAPPVARSPSETPTEDRCVERAELTGFSLVVLVPEPTSPSLSAELAEDHSSVILTSSIEGMPSSAWLCGATSVQGEILARFQQSPERSGDGELIMRVPTSDVPVDVEAWSWMATSTPCEDRPHQDAASLRLRVLPPTTSTTAPAAKDH